MGSLFWSNSYFRFWFRDWIFGLGPTCTLYTFFFYANVSVSAFSMALVAINRLVGVYFPHKMGIFSTTRAWIMVTLVWGISLGLMLLPLTEVWGQLGYEPLTFSCTILSKNGSSPMAFLLSFGFLLPLAIMIISYSLIFWKVHAAGRQATRVAAECRTSVMFENQVKRCESQMLRTVLLVSVSYVGCFLPGFLLMVIDPMPPCDDYPDAHVAGYIIFWCSGFLNPVIYVMSNSQFRSAFIRTLSGKCRAERETSNRLSRPIFDSRMSALHSNSNDVIA